MIQTLSRAQWRIVGVAWLTYAVFYLCRANIQSAIPVLQSDLGLSKSQIGLISAATFWAYGMGLVLNMLIGGRVSPHRYVLVGIVGSVIANVLFAFSSEWLMMMAVWFVNGFFQAMGWAPMLRMLANWLNPAQRTRVSGVFGSSFVVGTAFTWLLSGLLVATLGWRAAFLVPSVLFLCVGSIWYLFVRDTPQVDTSAPTLASNEPARHAPFAQELIGLVRRYWLLALAGIFLGFAYASMLTWTTAYYAEAGGYGIALASALAALLPIAGTIGTVLIGWIVGRRFVGREGTSLIAVLALLALSFTLYGFMPTALTPAIVASVVTGGLAYGGTSLFLATLPLALADRQTAAQTAALLELAFTLGATTSGAVTGVLLDLQGWRALYLAMAAATAVTGVLLFLALLRFRRAPAIVQRAAV